MSFKEFKEMYKSLKTVEERETFIKARVESLITTSEPQRIGMELSASYKGFITPDMGVSSNASEVFEDMKMDDLNVYQELMDYIHGDVDKYMYGELLL